jgi:hypothetical protein
MPSCLALRRTHRSRAWHLAQDGRSGQASAPQPQRRPVSPVGRVRTRVSSPLAVTTTHPDNLSEAVDRPRGKHLC